MKIAPISLAAALVLASGSYAALPPVPVPPENPITEPKRVLGKILFFDEQLSADNTVSCATCHTMTAAGSDLRRARNPGPDGVLNSPDDILASPGVIRSDALENYIRDQVFGANRQITSRTANSPINLAFAIDTFWDGRARQRFTDPVSGAVIINAGGGLESQVVGPPVSNVEMGHDGIAWASVTSKLAAARPLALATNLTADMAAALADSPSYGELFRRAFGDSAITAARIGMAVATYERTLIADDTPWDRFQAGQTNALTQGQIAGWNFFQNSNCATCHVPPLFTGNGFRNIGVRPPGEDLGRQIVTGNPADRGRFKVPSLRNVGLKNNFMHNGQMTTLTQVIQFYTRAPGSLPMFQDNLDALVPVPVPPQVAPALQDFLANGLTDARVRNGQFPFDAPTLYGQRPADQPQILGGTGTAGTGGIVPVIIAVTPPMMGNRDFKIGLDRAVGGTTARLALSMSPPVGGRITPTWILEVEPVNGASGAAGAGLATYQWPLTGAGVTADQTWFAQWIVSDAAATDGQAWSNVARIRFFCGTGGCPTPCPADITGDGTTTTSDLFDFLALFFSGSIRADINNSGGLSVQDVFDFLNSYFAGCPA